MVEAAKHLELKDQPRECQGKAIYIPNSQKDLKNSGSQVVEAQIRLKCGAEICPFQKKVFSVTGEQPVDALKLARTTAESIFKGSCPLQTPSSKSLPIPS